MEMFDLRWKTCFISDENLVVFHLVFHWVSRFIHLTQMEVIYWLLTAWIINEFENSNLTSLLKKWRSFFLWISGFFPPYPSFLNAVLNQKKSQEDAWSQVRSSACNGLSRRVHHYFLCESLTWSWATNQSYGSKLCNAHLEIYITCPLGFWFLVFGVQFSSFLGSSFSRVLVF